MSSARSAAMSLSIRATRSVIAWSSDILVPFSAAFYNRYDPIQGV